MTDPLKLITAAATLAYLACTAAIVTAVMLLVQGHGVAGLAVALWLLFFEGLASRLTDHAVRMVLERER